MRRNTKHDNARVLAKWLGAEAMIRGLSVEAIVSAAIDCARQEISGKRKFQ